MFFSTILLSLLCVYKLHHYTQFVLSPFPCSFMFGLFVILLYVVAYITVYENLDVLSTNLDKMLSEKFYVNEIHVMSRCLYQHWLMRYCTIWQIFIFFTLNVLQKNCNSKHISLSKNIS